MPEIYYPAIPAPTKTVDGLYETVDRLKESVETLTGHRDPKDSVFNFVNRVTTIERQFGTSTAKITQQVQIIAKETFALAQQIVTLEASVGDVSALVEEEKTARIEGDEALAADITSVEAKADQATANGEIEIKSMASPGGASASFGTFVRAKAGVHPELFAGMRITVNTANNEASIAFDARSMKFTDSGTEQSVFTYNDPASPGTFNFNVPVTIFNKDIGLNAVSNTSANTGQINAGDTLTAMITVRADARIAIEVKLTDTSLSTSGFIFVGAPPFVARVFPVLRDGVTIGNLFSMDTLVRARFLGGSSYGFDQAVTPSSQVFVQSGLAAGTYNFGIQNSSPFQLGMAISVTELSR